MDLQAEVEDPAQIGAGVAFEYFGDLAVAERSLQTPREAHQLLSMRPATVLLDRAQRVHEAIDAETDGVGKIRVENEELKDAIVGKVGGVDLAVGLEGGAGPQQADPLQVFESVVGIVGGFEVVVVVDLEQARGRRGALDIAADLNELPALAMAEGRVCDALEEVDA